MEASDKGTKFKRDDVTPSRYGQCRGCLAVGRHRDVMKEYYHDGNSEVYCDIFYECFNIFMSTNEDISTLICSGCIQKLRDAYNFKMTVLASEQTLLSLNKQPVFINVPYSAMGVEVAIKEELAQIKQEVSDTEIDADNAYDMETDNADFDPDYIPDDVTEENDLNADIKDVTISDNYKVKEEKFLARFGPGEIQLLPTKASLYNKCSNYFRHLEKLRGKIINSKLIPQIMRENTYTPYRQSAPRARIVDISEKYAYIFNSAAILEYSNATPFKSKKHAGFPCFYCKVVFANVDKLRKHQSLEHKKSEIKDALSLYSAEVLVINVDVTNLKCEICDESMPNLNEFKTHLVKVHKKELYPEHTNRIIPFKLSKNNVYECQVCGFDFVTFGAIERHMNVHFRNYVCTICGTGFVTNYRLKVHVKGMHDMGSYPCEVCNKVFKTQQKFKMHYTTVHNSTKRFRCAECQERFTEYFRKQKHMVEVHGFAPIRYKCNVCDKTFDRRYNLSRHQKRDHLEERDFKCDICAYQCFSNNELRFHMIKHNGERIHECSVCKKSYARKKTLREHMRIHNNDRRFSCAVCGQAFVQKCSLKGHIKTHHLEYSMQ